MMKKNIKFQEDAVFELVEKIKKLRSGTSTGKLVFQSPTGSGKTVMMIDLLNRINDGATSFIWVSFNSDNSNQSKEKFSRSETNSLATIDTNSLPLDLIPAGSVFFLNWQKIVSVDSENKILRKATEKYPLGMFKTIMNQTSKNNKIVLIIDEAHISAETVLARDIIDIISPELSIMVSATPTSDISPEEMAQGVADMMIIDKKEVEAAGLIKDFIQLQTSEEIDTELSVVDALIKASTKKLEDLRKLHTKNKTKVNPLLLVQLPPEKNNSVESNDQISEIKEKIMNEGIKENEIAIWLSDKHINLEGITENTSEIKVLIFKVAAATGWDAPRASILLMLRNTKSKVLYDQTLGRVMRQPLLERMKDSDLNKAYFYTNYTKNDLIESFKKRLNINISYTNKAKEDINPISFESSILSRLDYNDIKSDIVKLFSKKFISKINLNEKLIQNIATDALISNIDNKSEFKKSNQISIAQSEYDANIILDNVITEYLNSIKDEVSFAPLRSTPRLKNSLLWAIDNFNGWTRYQSITSLISEFSKEKFRNELFELLESYKLEFPSQITKNPVLSTNVLVPIKTRIYNEKYEKHLYKKSADEYVYMIPDVPGYKNEKAFIEDILETTNEVIWWWKNSDYGKEYLAIPYKTSGKFRLFYPDFIIKTKAEIYIIDTKKGETYFKGKEKLEALKKYCKTNGFKFGFAVQNDTTSSWHLATEVIDNPFDFDVIDLSK